MSLILHFYGSIVLITAFVEMTPKNIKKEIILRHEEEMWKKQKAKGDFSTHIIPLSKHNISFLMQSKISKERTPADPWRLFRNSH